jgi:hypothetical protein
MLLLVLERRLLWVVTNADGGTTSYYYNDVITSALVGAALLTVIYFLVRGYLRARALRRPRRNHSRENHRLLRRTIKAKRELSRQYLRPGFSGTIHAVGIGRLLQGYCIHVFVTDANQEWSAGSGATSLPGSYRGIPLVMIEMPVAEFLSETETVPQTQSQLRLDGMRDRHEVIMGGLSGANTNLTGECGTIGYFCTCRSKLPRPKVVHLLSNSHVFVDLHRSSVDESDLIMQPSPAETASNRPIASLVTFSRLRFANMDHPNHVDAAIARLWSNSPHKFVIPLIGAIKGIVRKADIEPGEAARKSGRTTGYTEGHIFSISLDIWVRYDRAGQSAFFQDQFLIEPDVPAFTKFAAKGDSGSLVVDAKQHAIGLLFAGMGELPESLTTVPGPEARVIQRVESYGVANPISEVLDRLKIDLLF